MHSVIYCITEGVLSAVYGIHWFQSGRWIVFFLPLKFMWQHFSFLSEKIDEIDVYSWDPPPPPNKLTCQSESMCDCSLIAVRRLKETSETIAAPAACGSPANIPNRIPINKHCSNFPCNWLNTEKERAQHNPHENNINHLDIKAFQSFQSSVSFAVKVRGVRTNTFTLP